MISAQFMLTGSIYNFHKFGLQYLVIQSNLLCYIILNIQTSIYIVVFSNENTDVVNSLSTISYNP